MKNKQIISSIAGIGILTGGIYFSILQDDSTESIQLVRGITINKVQSIVSDSGVIPIQKQVHASDLDEGNLLKNNSTLKQRIQGMSWYRDCIVGRLEKNICDQYIQLAFSIEQILQSHPRMLEKIQYEIWWQRYIRGEMNPSDMLSGNIASLLILEKIQQSDPELYKKSMKSPLWNKGIQHGEEYVIMGRQDLLTAFSMRIKQLDDHPYVEKQLNKFGFTRGNIFTDDPSKQEGIYGILDTVLEIQDSHLFSPDVISHFFESDMGKLYLEGKIDPHQALEYIKIISQGNPV